jgi:DNA-binding NarL/FixJ family response regulator
MSRPRILLADDHRIVSEGLRSLLSDEFELVGTVEDGRELVSAVRRLRPEAIVVDISMPHLNGIEAVIRVRKENPQIKVIFLTMHNDAAYARRALEAGAQGFVLKHSAAAELVLAIQAALKGQTFVTPALTRAVLEQARHDGHKTREPDQFLTARQREILELLAEGRSAKEIAVSLAISPRTVEFHKYQIMEAHGIHNNAELVHFAIKHGIVAV